ncbi:MAG TPA: hypothetical protein VGU69_15815 [Rhizomicrobium sp.]|nr:hypothetical protein [Rhizomicrobium sp.]
MKSDTLQARRAVPAVSKLTVLHRNLAYEGSWSYSRRGMLAVTFGRMTRIVVAKERSEYDVDVLVHNLMRELVATADARGELD